MSLPIATSGYIDQDRKLGLPSLLKVVTKEPDGVLVDCSAVGYEHLPNLRFRFPPHLRGLDALIAARLQGPWAIEESFTSGVWVEVLQIVPFACLLYAL